jgi:phosphonatase-like hydrolase
MDYELAVFDLAGTTVKDNKDVHRVLQSALRNHGVVISIDDANEVMGIPKPIAIRSLLEKRYSGVHAITANLINEIHGQFVSEMIRFYKQDISVGEKPGVSETFLRLKQMGLRIAVDTGFDRKITDPLLERLGWLDDHLIDFSVTSDEVKMGRPHADMIFKAMAGTGIANPKSVIKVGDTASDIQEGKAAGCGMVVALTSGAFSADDLIKESPHHLIDQIPDLLDLIR